MDSFNLVDAEDDEHRNKNSGFDLPAEQQRRLKALDKRGIRVLEPLIYWPISGPRLNQREQKPRLRVAAPSSRVHSSPMNNIKGPLIARRGAPR